MAAVKQDMVEWSRWMAAANISADTIGLRKYHIARLHTSLQLDLWREVTVDHLVDWLAAGAAAGWKPNTLRSWRASFRSFYTWGQGKGRRPDNPALLIPSVRVPRGLPRPTPDQVYEAAIAHADPRVRMMIRLGSPYGLRRSEIARVRAEDLSQEYLIDEVDGRAVTRLGWLLRVVGKGGHVREVPLEDADALAIREMGPGWIFPSPVNPGPLTPAHVGKLIRRELEGPWTTHTLRHRSGTKSYAGTKDLRAVQEFLGHTKPEITALYTGVGRDDIRAAMRASAA